MSRRRNRSRPGGRVVTPGNTDAPAPSRPSFHRRPLVVVGVAVFAVALAVRLLHLTQMNGSVLYSVLLGDSAQYDAWARRISGGDWLGTGVFYQAPLYPYFLGLLYALGAEVATVRIAQAVMGSMSCALLVYAGAGFFGRPAGVAAGLILAFYAPAIFFDSLVQKSVLDGLLVACLLMLLGGTTKPDARDTSVLMGITLGLVALTRENSLVLLPLVLLWMGIRGSSRRQLAFVALGVAVSLLPVAARNRIAGGEWTLTTSQFGPNLFIGNNAAANGTYVPLRRDRGNATFERNDATELAEAAAGTRLSPSEVSRFWQGAAFDWIRAHPGDWAYLLARKARLIVNKTEAPDTEDLATHAEYSSTLHLLSRVFNFGVLVPLAVFGMWVTRRRWRETWILYASIATYAASVMAFYVLDRYRYPMVPFMALFAGAGISCAGRWWRQNSVVERWTVCASIAVITTISWWPIAQLSSTRLQAQTHFNLGEALQSKGDAAGASAEYGRARALDPADAATHVNLGLLLSRQDEHERAVAEFLEALRLDPQSAQAHNNLAMELARVGDDVQAIAHFSAALRLDPKNASIHFNIGTAYARAGHEEEAVHAFTTALALDPDNADAHNNLGIVLASRGDLDGALAHFERAVALRPGFAEARMNLVRAETLKKSRR